MNEFGQRVFDAQIQVVNAAHVHGHATTKFLRELSQDVAPDVEMVRKIVLHLIKGHRLVGYHVSQKLRELQILEEAQALLHDYSSVGDAITRTYAV